MQKPPMQNMYFVIYSKNCVLIVPYFKLFQTCLYIKLTLHSTYLCQDFKAVKY